MPGCPGVSRGAHGARGTKREQGLVLLNLRLPLLLAGQAGNMPAPRPAAPSTGPAAAWALAPSAPSSVGSVTRCPLSSPGQCSPAPGGP